MKDRTSDGRPPRKAGAGPFRGGKGGKPPARKGGSQKPRGDRPERSEGASRRATSGERPLTGRNRDAGETRPPVGGRFARRSAETKARFANQDDAGGRPRGASGRERPQRHPDDREGARRSDGRGSRGNALSPSHGPSRGENKGRQKPRGRFVPVQAGEADTRPAAHGGGRIAKVIARAGACSRRDAEAWILQGRVAVNGTVLASPAFNVAPEDRITIDGKPLAGRERTRLFLFHKPRGLVTTNNDPEGRPTIFDVLPEDVPRLVSVGRLDINTEGLMLLTNDGGLARVLELPATGWLRRYRVRAHGETDQAELEKLMNGVTIEGIDYRGIEARLDRQQGANLWLTIGLREGKNREVKRVLESIGLEVNRLIRISYGPFQLGDLGEGALEEVPTRILKDQIGERLALEAGAEFEAPIFDRRPPAAHFEPEATGRNGPAHAGRARQGPAFSDRAAMGERAAHGSREAPRKRKHISTLREISREKQLLGPRQRIEKSATADRKGRAIDVERRVPPAWREQEEPAESRNGRRFARQRSDQLHGARRFASREPGSERAPGGKNVATRAPSTRAPSTRPGPRPSGDGRGGERPPRKPRNR